MCRNHLMVNKGQWSTGNEWNYTRNLLLFIFDDDEILASDLEQIRNVKLTMYKEIFVIHVHALIDKKTPTKCTILYI